LAKNASSHFPKDSSFLWSPLNSNCGSCKLCLRSYFCLRAARRDRCCRQLLIEAFPETTVLLPRYPAHSLFFRLRHPCLPKAGRLPFLLVLPRGGARGILIRQSRRRSISSLTLFLFYLWVHCLFSLVCIVGCAPFLLIVIKFCLIGGLIGL